MYQENDLQLFVRMSIIP